MDTRQMNQIYPDSHKFHGNAVGVLGELGFRLVNDLGKSSGPFGCPIAIYENPEGLFLSVAFENVEKDTVVSFGRCWCGVSEAGAHRGDFAETDFNIRFGLSNYLYSFSKYFGVNFQPNYHFSKCGNNNEKVLKGLIYDLSSVLPVVLQRITLADIVILENAEYGVVNKIVANYGKDYEPYVRITGFKGKVQ
jgi:hypothetical protein